MSFPTNGKSCRKTNERCGEVIREDGVVKSELLAHGRDEGASDYAIGSGRTGRHEAERTSKKVPVHVGILQLRHAAAVDVPPEVEPIGGVEVARFEPGWHVFSGGCLT